MSNNIDSVLLVGCGYMGQEYASVLQALNTNFLAVGRGKAAAEAFCKKTGVMPQIGGLQRFIDAKNIIPERAVVAVSAEALYETACLLVSCGVKEILLEKPGAVTYEQIHELNRLARAHGSRIYTAYNRRFYASVRKAKELIAEDGGVSSFHFEFTEWSHKIETLDKPPLVFDNWFLCNSTHVVDLAFYLGGPPKSMSSYVSGALSWYRKASSFSGAGITQSGASFSYCADWESAGRWSVEILTKRRRLILCPLEELKCQMRGTVAEDRIEIDRTLDTRFKPGLYLQTKAFLEQNDSLLLSIQEHSRLCEIYRKIEEGGQLN